MGHTLEGGQTLLCGLCPDHILTDQLNSQLDLHQALQLGVVVEHPLGLGPRAIQYDQCGGTRVGVGRGEGLHVHSWSGGGG